ncbi:DEAD/DEAH box helicase [Actinoplanes sp. NPDC049265]|uniref:DEAD/DEAH box helicase n=1 Tax=Actinoplanes sp. NPDC049265 TaxID=3363902 RepID=UPI003722E1FD
MASFTDLGVPTELAAILAARGITEPFPIQAATLPDSLAGRDVLGRGRTGSGKTYAFALPVIARLAASRTTRQSRRPRALILAPTRELANQIDAALAPLAEALGLRTRTVYGGVGAGPQITALRQGVDVLVACPGRLLDHLEHGHVDLGSVEITVLDEADHMADLGFLPVVRRLMDATPRDGQRLLFSATLDNGVDVLVKRFMRSPATHHVDPADEKPIEMAHHVLRVRHDDRFPVLVDLLAAPGRSVVFTRTKRRAKVLTRQLIAAGVPAVELHGNLAQNARDRNLSAFSDGSAPTLVATDIAARGIHVDDVALVIHADPPVEHKAYLHRSGRTARAGAAGTVITLMTDDQQSEVRDLTRRAGIRPTTTNTRPGDPVLSELAPGERVFQAPPSPTDQPTAARSRPRKQLPPTPAAPSSRGRRRGTRGSGPAQQPAAASAHRTTEGRSTQPSRAGQSTGTAQSSRAGQSTRSAQSTRTAAQPARTGQSTRTAQPARSSQTARSGQPARAAHPRGGAAAFSAGSRAGSRRGRA